MSFTPSQVVSHARQLIAVEMRTAEQAARQFHAHHTTYITAHAVIEICRERISAYADAFCTLLDAFTQPHSAAELRIQSTHSSLALNRLADALLGCHREEFDKFGQPTNGPVIGEEFRAKTLEALGDLQRNDVLHRTGKRALNPDPDAGAQRSSPPAADQQLETHRPHRHPPCRADQAAQAPQQGRPAGSPDQRGHRPPGAQ